MPIARPTELELVNKILAGSGLARTTDLSSARPDVGLAQQILTEVSREVQSTGWWFNEEEEVTLTPNVSDEIEVTEDIFAVWEFGASSLGSDVGIIGGRLYNKTDNTFTFTAPVTVNLIRYRDLADLPTTALGYIAARAARLFYERTRNANHPAAGLVDDELRHRMNMMEEDAAAANRSPLRHPSTLSGLRHRSTLP